MPTNPVGNKTSFLDNVTGLDRTSNADGNTFQGINQQLLNNDTFLKALITGLVGAGVNSGVINYVAGVADIQHSANSDGQLLIDTISANWVGVQNMTALIYGKLINKISGPLAYGGIQLNAPQASNITPALPGSAGDTLVFLEAWRNATDGSWQTRFRTQDGVDFATYPEGLGVQASTTQSTAVAYNPNIIAQGGNAAPLTSATNSVNGAAYNFKPAVNSLSHITSSDTGLYVAGTGDSQSKTDLATEDGYVYAIPIERVRRRNSNPYNPDTNLYGGAAYYRLTYNTTYQSATIVPNDSTSASESKTLMVGSYLKDANGTYYKITAVDTSTGNITLNQGYTATGTVFFYTVSDRPDGLYNNVIDASDIIDLRHQVSLTGFNYQAMLESSLDQLLRGALTTSQTNRYAREYIGLQELTDDVNTLLLCKYNGSIDGTANGATVTGTMSTGSPAFVNGVQGTGISFPTGVYASYPVNIAQGATTYSIEVLWKVNFNWNDNTYHPIIAFRDAAGHTNVQLYKMDNSGANQNMLRFLIEDDTGATISTANMVLPSSLSQLIIAGTWLKISVFVNQGAATISMNGVELWTGTLQGLPNAITEVYVGGTMGSSYATNGVIDSVRISSSTRTESQLPSGFNFTNGDRILDGGNGDFTMWSDDIGGTAGVNGRTNPYGLMRVPNQVAARVSYNGSEIRHYYGQGATPGWTIPSTISGTAPTGSFDGSNEVIAVTANEAADGTRTSFTFTKPTNATGVFVNASNSSAYYYLSTTNASLSSASIDGNGTLTLVYATAPTSGSAVQANYRTAARHAHFIPSTKGFVVHDWYDDSNTGGAQTFPTAKKNITSINHVRVNGTIQNGGYTVQGLNAATTLTAAAAATATTITVASATNFFDGQQIEISMGDGTYFTTSVGSISGNTITINDALTAMVHTGATVLGNASISFTSATASGASIDFIYEYVKTIELGDYIRIAYQHTPYQTAGVGGSPNITSVYVDKNMVVTTFGTGKATTSPAVEPYLSYPAGICGLPRWNTNDLASLKNDSLSVFGEVIGTDIPSDSSAGTVHLPVMGASSTSDIYKAGQTLNLSGSAAQGYGLLYNESGDLRGAMVSKSLDTAVPHLCICAMLVTYGPEVYLLVGVDQHTSTKNYVVGSTYESADHGAWDLFPIPGRPLIKGYGNIAA